MARAACRALVVAVLLLSMILAASDAVADLSLSGDVIRTWNEVAFGTARVKNLSDALAARAYAMVNVAMYDAVNGIQSKLSLIDRDYALVPPTGAPPPGHPIAAAAAAHAVLFGLFPDQAPVYDTQLSADLAALGSGFRVSQGQAWGAQVGAAVLAARGGDGATGTETQAGINAPGHFRTSWSAQPWHMLPFAIGDSSDYVGSGPPALTSLDYAAALEEVRLLGNAAITDAAKLANFQFWSLGGTTNQPPGGWLQVAIAVSSNPSMNIWDSARLFALVSLAMVDTVAPTYQTKWAFHHWRPATAIREAGTEGNPYVGPADPGWNPRAGGIGTSPEYWSGHSTFSGAAVKALQGFFCADAIQFTLKTDSAPGGVARTYRSFSQAEAEAGISRIHGGIHFNFSNGPALGVGRAIAAEILANKLLLKRGPTHFGECPR